MACKIISRQGLNPHCPPHTNQWKFRVLTTAPPVKSLSCSFIFKTISLKSKEAHLWNLYSTSQAPYLIPTVIISWLVMSAKSASLQLCPTPCTPIDCSLPGYSVHGILQATILERVAMPPPRGCLWPKDRTHILSLESPALAEGFFTTSVTWEAQCWRMEISSENKKMMYLSQLANI